MCGLEVALAALFAQAAAEPAFAGVGKFQMQDLGAIKPVAAGAALRDGGLRPPFALPPDEPLSALEGGVAAEPLPPAPAFLGGLHRFGGAPAFNAADGRMPLPAKRVAYSFNAVPKNDSGYSLRHGFGIDWAPPDRAFGLAARFGANGLSNFSASSNRSAKYRASPSRTCQPACLGSAVKSVLRRCNTVSASAGLSNPIRASA